MTQLVHIFMLLLTYPGISWKIANLFEINSIIPLHGFISNSTEGETLSLQFHEVL